jgi:hypothetical protein
LVSLIYFSVLFYLKILKIFLGKNINPKMIHLMPEKFPNPCSKALPIEWAPDGLINVCKLDDFLWHWPELQFDLKIDFSSCRDCKKRKLEDILKDFGECIEGDCKRRRVDSTEDIEYEE